MSKARSPNMPNRKSQSAKKTLGAEREDNNTTTLPSREEVLKYISNAPQKVGKREIARAFGLKGNQRVALKRLLADMAREGLLSKNRRALRQPGRLPPVTVIEIIDRDSNGDLIATPTIWDDEEGERPRALVISDNQNTHVTTASIGIGDKVLARISNLTDPTPEGIRFQATPIRRLNREKRALLGIFRAHSKAGGTIDPIDKKMLRSWHVQKSDQMDANDGDLVRFELVRKGRQTSTHAKVREVLGNPTAQRQVSLIAVHTHGIPDEFPDSVLHEVSDLTPPTNKKRQDLTALPLITIDPADARDHDDAVYAQPDDDKKNSGGFVVVVAIADVGHYVRLGTKLDSEARLRGNSVYFPDRVVPMLPEKISNDLCSLRENEVRPCIAVRMVFDKHGAKKSHTFIRAMMRSHAKLSYEEAQAAIDGNLSEKCKPLMDKALRPLWRAYNALASARDKRAPLDLDLPERRLLLDKNGNVKSVTTPQRLTAHRLIEEFMIQANVAAAESLEAKSAPLVYRTHERPSKDKLKALALFLESLDLKLPTQSTLRPAAFNKILKRVEGKPISDLVHEVILRSQSQAEYTTENAGHFGLNLRHYTHFTSPIRRYSDLIIHRALISAHRLGAGGQDENTPSKLADTAKHISETERRAMAAERETTDRLISAFLADRIGATFDARISGVTRAGLFVRLAETGADGFVPVAALEDDYYHHDEDLHALIGQRNNLCYRLGDTVQVRLVDAIPTAGALRFEMLTEGKKIRATALKGHKRNRQSRSGRAPRTRDRTRRR